jgi:hypothetical protein
VRSRRWLRFALPLAVVAGLATLTGVAHVVQQPDPTDASFLSPTSDAGDGARRLADGLAGEGVRVIVRTRSVEAIADAEPGGPITIFVTTPGLVHPTYLEQLASLPAGVHVVLVAPGGDELAAAGLAIDVLGPRWTATAPQPGCSAAFASAAGPAAVRRWQYGAAAYPAVRCYDDGLVEFDTGRAALSLVGAADPFRNDRAGEHGNRALARGLLARDPTVIWLDLHKREPAPEQDAERPDPSRPDSGQQDGGEGDQGDGDQLGGDYPQEDPEGDPQDGGQADGGSRGGGSVTDSALARAFPPAVWATLALLALAALALAAASARRLGAPVAEPLPVRVRAAETVRGLGGLYREVGKAVVGQDAACPGVVIALLCRGHVLLEGVPGVAKTLLVRTRSPRRWTWRQAGAVHARPDARRRHRLAGLRRAHRRVRVPRRARSSPTCCSPTRSTGRRRRPRRRCWRRWRSGRSRSTGEPPLPEPFIVLATQNPIEYEGTYPLPEAQLDRFLLKLTVPLPPRDEEIGVLLRTRRLRPARPGRGRGRPVAGRRRPGRRPGRGARVPSPTRCSRTSSTCAGRPGCRPSLELGVSPRGATALLAVAKAWAWLSGRDYVTPDDVKALAPARRCGTGCGCGRRPSWRASPPTRCSTRARAVPDAPLKERELRPR